MRKIKVHLIAGLFVVLASCDSNCSRFFTAVDSSRQVIAGTSKDIFGTGLGGNGTSQATQGNSVDDVATAARTTGNAPAARIAHALSSPPVYAVSSSANAVYVLGGGTLGFVGKIAVGNGPTRARVGTDNTTLYVTNRLSDSISVIDMGSNTVKATIALAAGSRPAGLAVNDTSLYVINSGQNSISVVDLASQKTAATLTAGSGPQAIALSPDGTLLWVANSDNTISVFDVLTNENVKTITGVTNPTAIAFTRDGTLAYVTSGVSGTGSLAVIGTVDYKIKQRIPVGSIPVSVSSDTYESLVYVANRGSGTITVLNGGDLSFIGNLNVPSPPNVVISVQ